MSYTSYVDYIAKSKFRETRQDLLGFSLDVNGEKTGIELPDGYSERVGKIASVTNQKLLQGDYQEEPLLRKISGMLEVSEVL